MRSAGKDPVTGEAALQLLEGVTDLYVARGKRVVHIDLREQGSSSKGEILELILGRSGTLRAPALRAGPSFYVGYNPDLLALLR